MRAPLSVLMITKNAEETTNLSLKSVHSWVGEIILIDDYSTDNTVKLAKKYGAKIFLHRQYDFGKQKAFGLKKCSFDWVLILDSDEVVSDHLKIELINLLSNPKMKLAGYFIPYQTHFLNRPLKYGGENYKKLVLFKRKNAQIKPALVHEEVALKYGETGTLKNKIYHYSYRSISQIYTKFTDYAIREARQKLTKGEKTSFKKIFFYPIHMFWARFIKDRGYKDGLLRIPLDLGFAYMEWLTYFLMLFNNDRET